ncbi:MAG: hypothetical protein IKA87_09310 [Lentisphaeria bacterium]|nr:hypothetical protein [Lentisphaeria bacterium]
MNDQLQDLSGMWEFVFLKDEIQDSLPAGLSFDSFAPVPGCFDLLPDSYLRRGTGIYRRKVEISGPVALTLEGVGLRGKVFWDGVLIADIDCAFSQRCVRFDAGALSEHELTVAVNNEFEDVPSAMFFRNYDFYAHGGIYRKITIRKTAEFDLEFLNVLPIDPDSGTVELRLKLLGDTAACKEVSIAFDHNQPLSYKLHDGGFCGTLKVPSPRLWAPAHPELHRVTAMVNGISFTREFGLRKIEIKNGSLFLNNEKLFLIGVNRHDAHPDFGYAVPQSLQIQDIVMLKSAGFNCIRGCHYPQSDDFLSMCDRAGMLVWEESLGWGNRESSMTDELFQKRQIFETEQMALKSINHPCVIIWGFLNECASELQSSRTLIKSLAEVLHRTDPTRPVTNANYRGTRDCCLDLGDIISFNTYPGWYTGGSDQFFDPEAVRKDLGVLEELASRDEYKDKPLLISEIGAEAMFGLRGGQRWSEDYQADLQEFVLRYVSNSKRCSGVLFWQYCDARTYISEQSQDKACGFNMKGLLDGYRRPKEAWRRLSAMLKNTNLRLD